LGWPEIPAIFGVSSDFLAIFHGYFRADLQLLAIFYNFNCALYYLIFLLSLHREEFSLEI
jgi:hypothetical protein